MKDVDASIQELFRRLPPEVAERIHQKYDEDRAEFLQVVKDMAPQKGPEYWANKSCTKCHARGIIGERTSYPPQPIHCPCVSKRYRKWLVEVRKYYNALRKQETGHAKTSTEA